MNIFRRKPIVSLQAEPSETLHLRRDLNAFHLIMLGIGCIVGTGIFVITGTVAAQNSGPAILISFVLAALASLFAALCYSEFASLVPVSGSAYTYGYAALGEIFAWIIGWDLILEYTIAAVTVAVGWSGYMTSFLASLGLHLPPTLTSASGTLITLSDGSTTKALLNVPAVAIVVFCTLLLILGIRASTRVNAIIVAIKLLVIGTFIIACAPAIDPSNWHPFVPANTGSPEHFGWSGILSGAGILFFAYIGFDSVSTAAQECRNPQRDLPIGIIGSLAVCTILYIAVATVATGVMPYFKLDVPDPIAYVATAAGTGWLSLFIKVGAIAGLSSVILVLLLGQSRIFWCISKDGLLPAFLSKLHPKFHTPWVTTCITGVAVAFFSAIFNIREASALCSIGTLLAFFIVCVSVLILRIREPHHRRVFKVPALWLIAPLGAFSTLYLMISLPAIAWIRLVLWLALGIVFYFTYSYRNSVLSKKIQAARATEAALPPQEG